MICAIVMAAGQSRRMGTQKLLSPLAGQTVIGHVIDQIAYSKIQQIFVVVSEPRNAVSHALSNKNISLVTNSLSDGDMLNSVRAGVRALPGACEAAILVLGDQPSIEPHLINQIIHRHHSRKYGMVVPIYNKKRGHPLLFSSRYFSEILTEYGGVGLRGLLQAHPDDVEEMQAENSSVLEDMDFPEDYQREQKRFQS